MSNYKINLYIVFDEDGEVMHDVFGVICPKCDHVMNLGATGWTRVVCPVCQSTLESHYPVDPMKYDYSENADYDEILNEKRNTKQKNK